MADGAEMVDLKLTFWHKGKKPGDIVTVRRDEVRSWYGFAKPVESTDPAPAPAAEPAPSETNAPASPKTASTVKAK